MLSIEHKANSNGKRQSAHERMYSTHLITAVQVTAGVMK